MLDTVARSQRDLARGWVGLLVWGPPLVAIAATAVAEVASATRAVVWSVALLWAGSACVFNAWRSGRIHCSITGPFFIALAAASLLHGLGLVPLGRQGWVWIGGLLALGGPLLTVLPERMWGRYSSRDRQRCC